MLLRHLLFPCLLFLVTAALAQPPIAPVNPEAAKLNAEGLERYADWVEREIEAGRLPMAETVIFRNGVLGYHAVQGVSDLATQQPLEANQIFHLMSMTKPIVSVAFLMLYQEGHFQLTDKVKDYLPEFADLRVARNTEDGIAVETDAAESDITIEQVLTHTAGFSHGLGGTKLDNEIAGALYYSPQADIATRVSTLAELPLVGQPGRQWYYSASPDILARLIEHFSEMTLIEFLDQRLFDPLGMEDTGYNVPEGEAGRVVANHEITDAGIQRAALQLPTSGNTLYGGTHGLYSTAADYLRFCRMLLNGGELDGKQYLSPKIHQLMTMNHVGDMRSAGQGFGLGFGVVTDVSETGVPGSEGQYFWSGAYSTYFFIDPQEELIAIFMSQRSPYSGYHERMLRQMIYQTLD